MLKDHRKFVCYRKKIFFFSFLRYLQRIVDLLVSVNLLMTYVAGNKLT